MMSFVDYLDAMESIDGWLDEATAKISHRLMLHQTMIGIEGNVCEIGVHHGRYLIALALGLSPSEKAIAIDIFENQTENVDQSGRGDRDSFNENVKRFFDAKRVDVIVENSLRLSPGAITETGNVRFFSVDGGHTSDVVLNDLSLAQRSICPGGIVALDDILHPAWTGVVSGLARYKYLYGGNLKAFALLSNKLLMCNPAFVSEYRRFMNAEFGDLMGRSGLEMMSDKVDQFNTQPGYMLEIAARQKEVISQLRAEHDRIIGSHRYRIGTTIVNAVNRVMQRF